MEEKEEFTMIHGLKFKLKDPHSETLKRVVHDWEHHSDHNKLHDLLHEARNTSDNKQHFKDEGVTAVHHSDGYYTLEKTKHH